LARRLRRDILERGRDVDGVLKQYERFVKPAFDDYISPTKRFADIVIPRGSQNSVAISLLASLVKSKLLERGWQETVVKINSNVPSSLPPSVHVMDQKSPQIQVMATTLRDRTTTRDSFIFAADRMSRIIIEKALNLTPFTEQVVPTPTGCNYNGVKFYDKLCAISIMRSGDAMTKAVLSVVRDVKLGSVLIQTSVSDGPRLFFCQFPQDLADHFIFLCDPTIGSGNTGLMAIRILLDHGVPENRIIFTTILASAQGLHVVTQRHPNVQIICGMIDNGLVEGIIQPGLGHFGNRYFGTEDEDQV